MHLFKGVFYTQILSNVSGLECFAGSVHSVSVLKSPNVSLSQTQNPDEVISIDSSKVELANLLSWSGVIHGIDRVLVEAIGAPKPQPKPKPKPQNVHKLCDSKSLGDQQGDVGMFGGSSNASSNCPIVGESFCRVVSPSTLTSICSSAEVREESLKSVSLVGVCYSGSSHKCVGGFFVCPIWASEECAGFCYSPDQFTCQSTNQTTFALCPKGYQLCGSQTCFDPKSFDCQQGILILKPQGQLSAVTPTAQPNMLESNIQNPFFGRVVGNITNPQSQPQYNKYRIH